MAQVLSVWARQAWLPSASADKGQLLLVGLLEERYTATIELSTIIVKPTPDLAMQAQLNLHFR